MTFQRLSVLALATLLMVSPVAVYAGERIAPIRKAAMTPSGPACTRGHLSADSTIGDLLDHPAFAGFAPLLLPRDDVAYRIDMPLHDVGALMPYHSHVEPDVVVAALNRMIDAACAGETLFLPFYSEADRRSDPAKAGTGLFVFRGRPGAPFAVVAPGGGFAYVGSLHEGFPYATAITDEGYNAFVLRYRVGQGGRPATEDLAAAVSFIRRNAASLKVNPDGYSLWGSSAGARMAASIGSHGLDAFGGGPGPKPSAVIMAYTAHSDVSGHEPPTFVVVGDMDGIAPPATMERRVAALRRAGGVVEYHRYPGVAHGFGTGVGTSAAGWLGEAIAFWGRFHDGKE
ncbi:hypothetical protein GCM10007301_22710 [Azorhizobium oxalatiphilum]|uniref:Acetyl esterase/lipase n=1 Tax=Azorhizobium oxalatiphilum TaxID=980631 RepID=A0A917BZ96_9HYPH|nr:alpha/beta hydrolase [Azorhizobium oxalatiphilum]GGF62447.1 hypothetical protein GCM10007301_22710 [Azorhizobium oxalatiphilum]